MQANDLFPTPQSRRDFMRSNRQSRLQVLIAQKVQELKDSEMGQARHAFYEELSPEIKRQRRSQRKTKSAYDRFLEAQINQS